MAEDRVLAHGNYGWGDIWSMTHQPSKRRDAIEAVCKELPGEQYDRFRERMQEWAWFTPPLGLGGCSKNIPKRKIIFISSIWEFASDELVQYIVLHEMLHVILGHNTDLNRNDADDCELNAIQESEVDKMIMQLGFVDRRQEAFDFLDRVKSLLGADPQ